MYKIFPKESPVLESYHSAILNGGQFPYLNIPLFCFDSEFVPFVCLFFPTVLNTASF